MDQKRTIFMAQVVQRVRESGLFEEADDTRREDEPGDWFVADFDSMCSRGGETFGKDVTIRADGDGGWECRGCVDADGENSPLNLHGEDPYAVGGAA